MSSRSEENKDGKVVGIIVTAGFHALLIILCLIFGFTKLSPPLAGIEVGFMNLGDPNAGGASVAEMAKSDNQGKQEEVAEETQPEEVTPDEKVITAEESPVVIKKSDAKKPKTKKPKKKTENKKEQKEKKEAKPQVSDKLKNMLGGALNGPDKQGNGKGTGEGNGMQGSPDGQKDGNNGGGGGGYAIGGRKAIRPPRMVNDCGATGRVELRISIDREGNVLSNVEVVGGTTQNSCLRKKAIAAAKQMKYQKKSNAKLVQTGIIILRFSVN